MQSSTAGVSILSCCRLLSCLQLNHILRENHGKRIAVIENEVGSAGVVQWMGF